MPRHTKAFQYTMPTQPVLVNIYFVPGWWLFSPSAWMIGRLQYEVVSFRTSTLAIPVFLNGFLRQTFRCYHPREHLPPPGQMLYVFLVLSCGSLYIWVLSLDRRSASVGAYLLPALPSLFRVCGLVESGTDPWSVTATPVRFTARVDSGSYRPTLQIQL